MTANRTLFLASGISVDLEKKIYSKISWIIVTCIAEYWIVYGDLDGQATMANISNNGDIKSTLKLTLTSNEQKPFKNRSPVIFTLHKAFIRCKRGTMLAVEREDCCHLISVEHGRMSKLQSIDSIVPPAVVNKLERVVMSVNATHTEGEFIFVGHNWTKKITIKLK